MSDLKTNVTIKFTSKEHGLYIISELEKRGYENDREWNNNFITSEENWFEDYTSLYIHIYSNAKFSIFNFEDSRDDWNNYESFTEFENSLNHSK